MSRTMSGGLSLFTFLLIGCMAMCVPASVDAQNINLPPLEEEGITLNAGRKAPAVFGAQDKFDFIKSGPASGETGGELSLWYLNRYFFRGLRFSKNDVCQPEISIWHKGFKIKGKFNYDFKDNRLDETQFNEADVTASYNVALNQDAVLEMGYTYYGYPHQVMGYHIHQCQEFFAGIDQRTDFLDASLYGYYDFTDGSGSYFELTLGKRFRYKDLIEPYVRANTNLNVRYFNDATEISHSIFTAGLPIYLGEHVILDGSFNYQWGVVSWVEDKWYVRAGLTLRW